MIPNNTQTVLDPKENNQKKYNTVSLHITSHAFFCRY